MLWVMKQHVKFPHKTTNDQLKTLYARIPVVLCCYASSEWSVLLSQDQLTQISYDGEISWLAFRTHQRQWCKNRGNQIITLAAESFQPKGKRWSHTVDKLPRFARAWPHVLQIYNSNNFISTPEGTVWLRINNVVCTTEVHIKNNNFDSIGVYGRHP